MLEAGEKALRPVRPNAGIGAMYQRKLEALVLAMHESVMYWVKASYRRQAKQFATDANPATELQSTLDSLSKQWEMNFDTGAEELGKWFAQRTRSYSDGTLATILHDIGISVNFKMTAPMRTSYAAVINENVGLIRTIAQQHLGHVQTLVMQSVQNGRDLGTLAQLIEHRYGLTKKRAALIARDQNNKATSTLNRTRQREIGVTHAIWKHSHAGKEPRASHLNADGKRYEIAKGLFLDGKFTQTGEEINCRCTSQPIVKGFKM
jgi:uncharacterized protein with gpF-like domain